MAAKSAPAPEAAKATEVVTSTGMEIVDNTDTTFVPEAPAATEEYELVDGLTQVNYL